MVDEPGRFLKYTKRGPIKKFFKRILVGAILGSFLYSGAAIVYATKTVYKVKTNYAVVLEKFGGERIVKSGLDPKNIGWNIRAPFFTKFEQNLSLMQREMYLDGDITPHTVVSKDNISLLVSGLLTYRIVDPYKWAVEMEKADSLLQRDFNGMVKDVVQGGTEDEIIHKRDDLKNKVFKRLKTQPINIVEGLETKTLEQKYGIQLVSFNITDAEYPQNLMEASQRKKELELIADGEKQAILRTYQGHAEGVKKFMEATGLSKAEAIEYLNQQRWASSYEKSTNQKTYVINNTNQPVGMTIPTGQQEQEDKIKKEVKKDMQGLEERLEDLESSEAARQGSGTIWNQKNPPKGPNNPTSGVGSGMNTKQMAPEYGS